VALAIAVFEHIPSFTGAFEAALGLIRSDGLLLFEVPLIRTKNDIWFRSSLEHLHYPTERSLKYLFDNVLGLPLVGATIEVENYGCVYVGLTSGSTEVLKQAGGQFEYLLRIPVPLDCETFNPLILRRVIELWVSREERFDVFKRHLDEVEKARDWHAAEWQKRDEVLADHQQQLAETQQFVAKLKLDLNEAEQARDWHATESRKRDEVLADHQQQLAETQQFVAKLKLDLDAVEQARDWHAAESRKRDEILADQQHQLAETQQFVAKLKLDLSEVEQARDWHAAESRKRDEVLADQQHQLAETQQFVAKLKLDLNEVEQARDWHAAESRKRDEVLADQQHQLAETQQFVAKLKLDLNEAEQARDWHAAESRKRDGVLAGQQQQLAQTRQHVEMLNQTIAEQEKRLRSLVEVVNCTEKCLRDSTAVQRVQEARICEMQNSWSWKITKPLRVVLNLLGVRAGSF
jgi:hypothetical protein